MAFQTLTTVFNPETTIVSDIETNGLLDSVTEMHCGVHINPFTLKEYRYDPSGTQEYISTLSANDCTIGHNFRGYDLLALEKLFSYQYGGFCFDTLVLSRLLDPERRAHSLEYWGNFLKFHKGTFGKTSDWSVFTKEMLEYCAQDVRVNAVLFLYFVYKLGWASWFGSTEKECKRLADAIKRGDLEVCHG